MEGSSSLLSMLNSGENQMPREQQNQNKPMRYFSCKLSKLSALSRFESSLARCGSLVQNKIQWCSFPQSSSHPCRTCYGTIYHTQTSKFLSIHWQGVAVLTVTQIIFFNFFWVSFLVSLFDTLCFLFWKADENLVPSHSFCTTSYFFDFYHTVFEFPLFHAKNSLLT